MGDAHTHGGDCCEDCARARARGNETPCDRARRLGKPAPCDGGACAVQSRRTGCAACGYRATGCLACSGAAVPATDGVGLSPRDMWMASLQGAAGVQAQRELARRTGVPYTTPAPTRNPGETDAAWRARWAASHWDENQATETPAEYRARMAAYQAGGGRGAATPAASAPAAASPSSGGAPANPTAAQWMGFAGQLIGAAASTTLALVEGARESDRQARQDAAAAEAARLARADDEASRASVGAEAAENAYQKARTASLLLPDRAAATAKLSEAQGHLAGAVAARSYFEQSGRRVVPPALADAIRRATAEVDRVAALIERSDVPPPPPSASNPPAAPEPPPPSRSGLLSSNAAKAGVVGALGLAAYLFFGRGR